MDSEHEEDEVQQPESIEITSARGERLCVDSTRRQRMLDVGMHTRAVARRPHSVWQFGLKEGAACHKVVLGGVSEEWLCVW